MKRLFILIALIAAQKVESQEPLLSCADDAYVSYSAPHGSVKDRVIVQKISAQSLRVKEERDPGSKQYSPQQTAAFNRVLVADPTKQGQRDNAIHFFALRGPRYAWKMDIKDMMDNARITWLNEDLVFVQVWWGRIVSTDLIFQMSTGRFIYSQEANYGALVQPCE